MAIFCGRGTEGKRRLLRAKPTSRRAHSYPPAVNPTASGAATQVYSRKFDERFFALPAEGQRQMCSIESTKWDEGWPVFRSYFRPKRTPKRTEATGQLWLRIPALLCIGLFQRAILRPHQVAEIEIGEGETVRLRFSGVRYKDVDNSVVEVEF